MRKGIVRGVLEWYANHPLAATVLALGTSAPWWFPSGEGKAEFWEQPNLYAVIGMCIGIPVVGVALKWRMQRKLISERDKKIIRTLEKRLEMREHPSFAQKGEVKVGISFGDYLYSSFVGGNSVATDRHRYANRGREKNKPSYLIEAAAGYLAAKELDEALLCIRDALGMLDGKRPKLSWLLRPGQRVGLLAEWLNRLFYPKNLESYVMTAVKYAFTNPERSWYWSTLAKKFADAWNHKLKTEIYVFDALLADAQQRSDAVQAWKDAFRQVEKTEHTWERIGETRSVVRKIADSKFFGNTFVFKQHRSLDALITEVENIASLEKISSINPPHVFYADDKSRTFAMRFMRGETLYEKLKQDDKSVMPAVVDALADIHMNMPRHLEREKSAWKLRAKLLTDDFAASKKTARTIVKNYRPVYNAIRNNTVWVWNKDAHPENWIVGEGIGVIDAEANQCVPAQFDLVNLLEYSDFFTKEEVRAYITRYRERTKITIDEDAFMLGYQNAIIHRMISLSSAWSSPFRKSLHSMRKGALQRAVNAIDAIKEDHREYYEANKEQYLALRKEFTALVVVYNS